MAADPHEPNVSPPGTQERLRLERLRKRRVFAPRDQSLGFLKDRFKQDVARPFRQLEGIVEAWAALIPADLRQCSRLESLQRGTLTVAVDSSATHFRLDQHVRSGLTVEIAKRSKGSVLRKIRLRVDAAAFADEPDDKPDFDPGQYDLERDFDPELPR